MTKNEDMTAGNVAFIKTLIFSMEKILEGTDRDNIQIMATRYGRIISGIKNGSRNTLERSEIRVFTYHLELIRRNWPLDSEWVCKEIASGKYFVLIFERKGRKEK